VLDTRISHNGYGCTGTSANLIEPLRRVAVGGPSSSSLILKRIPSARSAHACSASVRILRRFLAHSTLLQNPKFPMLGLWREARVERVE
jgi:hypothetical protein